MAPKESKTPPTASNDDDEADIQNPSAILKRNKQLLDEKKKMIDEKMIIQQEKEELQELLKIEKEEKEKVTKEKQKESESKKTAEERINKIELEWYEEKQLQANPDLLETYKELEYPCKTKEDIDKAIAKTKMIVERTKKSIQDEKAKEITGMMGGRTAEQKAAEKQALQKGGEEGIEAYMSARKNQSNNI